MSAEWIQTTERISGSEFAQMGKLNGEAILKIHTANYFAESFNIINIEKRVGRKIRKRKYKFHSVWC